MMFLSLCLRLSVCVDTVGEKHYTWRATRLPSFVVVVSYFNFVRSGVFLGLITQFTYP